MTYEETGSELIALLKEAEEIKINKPKYNRSLKKTIFPLSLYQEKDLNGYIALRIQKTDARKKELASFSSPAEAQSALFKITDSYQLCQKINGLETVKSHCFSYELNQCNGACIQKNHQKNITSA